MVHFEFTGAIEKITNRTMKPLIRSCQLSVYLFAMLFLFRGCVSGPVEPQTDTIDSGTIYISSDESFRPVIDSQIKVFEALHPKAKIVAFYKPEAECIADLKVDSIRMVIITRSFTKEEENFIVDSFKLAPKSLVLAQDAIAVIVPPSSPDTLFTMGDIKQILTGRFRKNLIPIFDGTRATSTVRFVIDSVLRGDTLTPHTMAANTSEGVIDYVSKNQNTIGFIGVSWIGNHEDTTQLSFLKKVRMVNLQSTDIPDAYILPWQANIYLRRYPMIRDLVYILKEKYLGLGKGFANFLSGEQGQLVFRRAYLWPAQMNFNIRVTKLNE
jgi:phosphate transport system substrate-binding protein